MMPQSPCGGSISPARRELFLSPRAGHPAMSPQQRTSPALCLSKDDVAAMQRMSVVPPGLPGHLKIPRYEPAVYRKKDPGNSSRIAFSWNKKGDFMSSWDENRRGNPTRAAEDVIMKRIIETREELGRLQRENNSIDSQEACSINNPIAHTGKALWAENDGKTGAYSWAMQQPPVEDDDEIYARYDQDQLLSGRWPTREQELLKELEFTNAKLQKERKRKKYRGNFIMSGARNDAAIYNHFNENNDPWAEIASAGWDFYTPAELLEVTIPCTFKIYLGEHDTAAIREIINAPRHAIKDRLMESLSGSLADRFHHPSHRTSVTAIRIVNEKELAAETKFRVNRLEAEATKKKLDFKLKQMTSSRLQGAQRVLYDVERKPAHVELIPSQSQIGSQTSEAPLEGYSQMRPERLTSDSIKILIDTEYKRFSRQKFISRLSPQLGITENQIEVLDRSRAKNDNVDLTFRFVNTKEAVALSQKFVEKANDKNDGVHNIYGKIDSVEVIGLASPTSPSSSPSRSSSRRRRRRGESSRGRRRGESSRGRRRRSSSGSSSGGRRRRRGSSSSGSSSSSPGRSRRRRRSSQRPEATAVPVAATAASVGAPVAVAATTASVGGNQIYESPGRSRRSSSRRRRRSEYPSVVATPARDDLSFNLSQDSTPVQTSPFFVTPPSVGGPGGASITATPSEGRSRRRRSRRQEGDDATQSAAASSGPSRSRSRRRRRSEAPATPSNPGSTMFAGSLSGAPVKLPPSSSPASLNRPVKIPARE